MSPEDTMTNGANAALSNCIDLALANGFSPMELTRDLDKGCFGEQMGSSD